MPMPDARVELLRMLAKRLERLSVDSIWARRASGLRVGFEDNAAVLVDDTGLPKGTEIKGAIAREVAERFPKVAAIAAAVV